MIKEVIKHSSWTGMPEIVTPCLSFVSLQADRDITILVLWKSVHGLEYDNTFYMKVNDNKCLFVLESYLHSIIN